MRATRDQVWAEAVNAMIAALARRGVRDPNQTLADLAVVSPGTVSRWTAGAAARVSSLRTLCRNSQRTYPEIEGIARLYLAGERGALLGLQRWPVPADALALLEAAA